MAFSNKAASLAICRRYSRVATDILSFGRNVRTPIGRERLDGDQRDPVAEGIAPSPPDSPGTARGILSPDTLSFTHALRVTRRTRPPVAALPLGALEIRGTRSKLHQK